MRKWKCGKSARETEFQLSWLLLTICLDHLPEHGSLSKLEVIYHVDTNKIRHEHDTCSSSQLKVPFKMASSIQLEQFKGDGSRHSKACFATSKKNRIILFI